MYGRHMDGSQNDNLQQRAIFEPFYLHMSQDLQLKSLGVLQSVFLLSYTVPTVPDGLVVRIRRSHRRGRGSIPRLGEGFHGKLSRATINGNTLLVDNHDNPNHVLVLTLTANPS